MGKVRCSQRGRGAAVFCPRLLSGRPRGEATYYLSFSGLASFGRVLCVHRFSQRVRFRKRWQIPCRRPTNGRCTTRAAGRLRTSKTPYLQLLRTRTGTALLGGELREAVSSPTIRVTAQQCFQRTGEGGKIHTLSTLEPRRPHVIIDDNAEICKEARRTNALVVQVNKRLGVIGLVDELRVLRNTIQFYNRDRLYPAFVLPPHRYLPNS